MAAQTERRMRTRLDPSVRRRQIVEAAARVFARNDPAEVTLESVAEEAGVSRSLVYSYFSDRGTLFAAAYSHELGRLDHELGRALDPAAPGRERLRQAVSAYVHFAFSHPEAWELIASAVASRHPAVREAIEARTERIAAAIRPDFRTRLVVRGVLGMLEAAAVHAMEHDAADPEAVTELLTQAIWSGISSLGPGAGE